MSNLPPRKRNRISLSCNQCKKRKVKCDREYPCGSCIKVNTANLCEFSDRRWSDKAPNSGGTQSVLNSTFSIHKIPIEKYDPLIGKENSGNNSPDNQSPVNPVVQSELNMLKDKIKQIEATLGTKSTPNHPKDVLSVQSLLQMDTYTSQNSNIAFVATGSPQPYLGTSAPYINYNTPLPQDLSIPALPNLPWNPNTPNANGHSFKGDIYVFDSERNAAFVGVNRFGSPNDTINFYEGDGSLFIHDRSRRQNCGPFSWLVIAKMDPALSRLWVYMKSKKIEKKRHWLMSRAKEGEKYIKEGGDDVEQNFREKAMVDKDVYERKRSYHHKHKKHFLERHNSDGNRTMKSINRHGLSVGLTLYDGKIDEELKLIEKVEMILPDQKVIWTLISKFFSKLYPFMSFIDEGNFKEEIIQILGPEDYKTEKIKSLKVERKIDFAHIGILLILLRVSYLSLFSNRNEVNEHILNSEDLSPNSQETKYLLSNPINIDSIQLAQLCLDQFNLLRKVNLNILQLAILMRIYHKISPEDGDGADGGESQIYNGLLIQMAYSMGINRDPSHFKEISFDKKSSSLIRKTWYVLMSLDLMQTFQYGSPLCIDEKYFDTKVPTYSEGGENINDVDLEKSVMNAFGTFLDFYNRSKVILEIALNIKANIKVKDFVTSFGELEIYLEKLYGNMSFYLKPFEKSKFDYPFEKIIHCRNYLDFKCFTLSLMYHLFLFYENKREYELALFYFKKIFAITCTEFIRNFDDFLNNNKENFGDGADLILNPSLVGVLHRTNQFNFAMLVRINATIYKMRKIEEQNYGNIEFSVKLNNLNQLSKRIQKVSEYCIMCMSKFSRRYYYAWRVTKAHNFILQMIITQDFYNTNHDFYQLLLDVKHEQIKELILIFNTSKVEDFEVDCNTSNANEQSKSSNSKMHQFKDSSSANFGEFKSIDTEEIDQLWFQMVSMKQGTTNKPNSTHVTQTPNTDAISEVSTQDDNLEIVEQSSIENNKLNSILNNNIAMPAPFNPLGGSLNDYLVDFQEGYPFDIFTNLAFDDYFSSST